jgi:hypothetical protein
MEEGRNFMSSWRHSLAFHQMREAFSAIGVCNRVVNASGPSPSPDLAISGILSSFRRKEGIDCRRI